MCKPRCLPDFPLTAGIPVTRIFLVLAWFAVLFVAATLILGLTLGDIRHDLSADTRTWATVHRLSGVAAALAVVFADSVVVTYFIGTSRWCKEVVQAYSLDGELIRRSSGLKRRTFPWAVISMLSIVGVVALGGAADPATGRQGTEAWSMPHLLGALLGLGVIAFCFVIQWNNIHANHGLIAEILAHVKRIRAERGLDKYEVKSATYEMRDEHK